MQTVEIELKFTVVDVAALESKLVVLGFRLKTPQTFESNTLYDTPERALRATGQILRLRQYGSLWTLTHKAQPPLADNSRYKQRIETETTIGDGDSLATIFAQLGYEPVFRYEKWRAEWSELSASGDLCHLDIDHTPIGVYAELEGPPSWIDFTLERLDVAPSTCITESYGRLFLEWREQTGSSAKNLTFAEISVSELAPQPGTEVPVPK